MSFFVERRNTIRTVSSREDWGTAQEHIYGDEQ